MVAMSAAARASGVQIGMRRGSVQMLLADAIFQTRDPEREQQSLLALALTMLQYTPNVTTTEHATLLMEVGASLRLFGGVRQLCRQVRASVATLGLSAHLGCAPYAQSAWLLAHQAARQQRSGYRLLRHQQLARRIAPLPIALLPAAAPWLDWLHGMGCYTLHDLQQLPRPGLQRRCGKALLQAIDAAYGVQQPMYPWIIAPTQFQTKIELPDRMEHAAALLAYAQIGIAQLIGWLNAKQLAVKTIHLSLQHERGRQAQPPTELPITLAEAVWREAHLVLLLKEKLAQLQLSSPVIALTLTAPQVEAMQAPSESLFPTPGGNSKDHHRLIELLVARLGEDHVLQAAPKADHRPDIANQWIPILHKADHSPLTAPAAPATPRPCWLLPNAVPLKIHQHRPYYHSPLTIVSPAERIEAGWWDGRLCTRDYFVAKTNDQVHYWIYRERVGVLEDDQALWYLQGVFG